MPNPLSPKFTLNDLRAARQTGKKIPMLTCYDFTTAKLMQEAGVPALLVGDSAGNVILGYGSTVPVSLNFMIELTAAVRRGAPNVLLMGDMPFGSYQQSDAQGVKNVVRMLKLTGCDCVKLEVAASHTTLVKRLADAGVAVMAHLGLRPQTVGFDGWISIAGSYRNLCRGDSGNRFGNAGSRCGQPAFGSGSRRGDHRNCGGHHDPRDWLRSRTRVPRQCDRDARHVGINSQQAQVCTVLTGRDRPVKGRIQRICSASVIR